MKLRKIPQNSVLETNPPVAFASRLALREGNAKKPIYQLHKWWARRLGSVFRSLLLSAVSPPNKFRALRNGFFYAKHDLSGLTVLDPFVGGGTSVVEAAKCGANVIGIDIDPVACFITSKEIDSIPEQDVLDAFREIEKKVRSKILRWYRATLPDGRKGAVVYCFWVDKIKCPCCKIKSFGHPHYQLSRDRKNKRQVIFCSHCGDVADLSLRRKTYVCTECHKSTVISDGPVKKGIFTCYHCDTSTPLAALTSPRKRLPRHLFALEVLVEDGKGRVFMKAGKQDLALYARASREWQKIKKGNRIIPTEKFLTRDRVDPRPVSFGYTHYRDLFNDRQLLCLAMLGKAIRKIKNKKAREYLAIAFSDCLAANNMMCYYAFDYQKLTPLFGLHAYNKISRPVENNVWGTKRGRGSFVKCFSKVIRAKSYSSHPYEYRYDTPDRPTRIITGESIRSTVRKTIPSLAPPNPFAVILNQSSANLKPLHTNSVDLILTDPPYYGNLAYSEMSDFYHVWLKRLRLAAYSGRSQRHTPQGESFYVRQKRRYVESEHVKFVTGLSKVFKECHRVLKENSLFVFTYHHNDLSAWEALAIALCDSGFRITNVFPIRSEGQSSFHSAKRNLKWDAVFCCRKRKKQARSISSKLQQGILLSAQKNARKLTSHWKNTLKKGKLDISVADLESLRRAFIVQNLINAGCSRSGLEKLFTKINQDLSKVSGKDAK